MNIITKNHIIEFIALLVSLMFFNSLRKGKLKSLPFFLLFILCIELFASYLVRIQKITNYGLYNISIPIEYSFYCFLFWLHGERHTKWFLKAFYVVFILIVCYHFVVDEFLLFHMNVLLAGNVIVVVCCCIYIYELFQQNIEGPILTQYFFWMVTGLLLFNLGEFVYFLFLPVFKSKGWDRFDIIFRLINNSLLYVLYLSYIVAMLVYHRYQRRKIHAA